MRLKKPLTKRPPHNLQHSESERRPRLHIAAGACQVHVVTTAEHRIRIGRELVGIETQRRHLVFPSGRHLTHDR